MSVRHMTLSSRDVVYPESVVLSRFSQPKLSFITFHVSTKHEGGLSLAMSYTQKKKKEKTCTEQGDVNVLTVPRTNTLAIPSCLSYPHPPALAQLQFPPQIAPMPAPAMRMSVSFGVHQQQRSRPFHSPKRPTRRPFSSSSSITTVPVARAEYAPAAARFNPDLVTYVRPLPWRRQSCASAEARRSPRRGTSVC